MRSNPTRVTSFPLEGGLDLTTSPLFLPPGKLTECKNYEIANVGGYRRIDGYERFDGREKPSGAEYYILTVLDAEDFYTGDVVTDSVTGATATVLQDAAGVVDGLSSTVNILEDGTEVLMDGTEYLADGESFISSGLTVNILVGGVSGSFGVSSALSVAGSPKGTITAITGPNSGATTTAIHITYLGLAEALNKAAIAAVPGSGSILGVWLYKDTVYTFRNNSAGDRAYMWGSSSAGWVKVTTPPLNPDGVYRFINHNFGGHSGTLKMYGVDGANNGFEFDGVNFVQIETGMVDDRPNALVTHYNYLFFAFPGGSVQHSSVGDPLTWSPLTGASEMGVGDEVTDFLSVPGGNLIIWTKNTLSVIYGSTSDISSANLWQFKRFSADTGGVSKTAQMTLAPVFLSDTGLSMMSTSEAFGDFQANTLSLPVQKFIDAYRSLAAGSVVLRGKNQYRLLFSNGEALVMTFSGSSIRGFTISDYLIPIRCVSGTSRSDDTDDVLEDEVYFGSDDGFVYQMDSGYTFDGSAIEAYFQIPYTTIGPNLARHKKRWRKAVIEVDTDSGGQISIGYRPELDMFGTSIPAAISNGLDRGVTGGFWDYVDWDEFYWSTESEVGNYFDVRINGISPGIGAQIYSSDINRESHTVRSVIYHYDLRGLQR